MNRPKYALVRNGYLPRKRQHLNSPSDLLKSSQRQTEVSDIGYRTFHWLGIVPAHSSC
jgi:hypothetical protein